MIAKLNLNKEYNFNASEKITKNFLKILFNIRLKMHISTVFNKSKKTKNSCECTPYIPLKKK